MKSAHNISIIVVEDSQQDFVLLKHQLRRQGIVARCVLVSSAEALVEALQGEAAPDLVLSDYKIPGLPFDSILDILRTRAAQVPVIVVSGTIGEECAVDLMKRGVSDFVLKSNLARLAPSVMRALREAEERRTKEQIELKLKEQGNLLDQANDAIIVRSLTDTILYWNKAAERQYGWKAEEVLGKSVVDVLYSVSKLRFDEALAILMKEGDFSGRITHTHRDGRKVVVQSHWVLVRDEHGHPRSILAIHTDLTDRVALEEQLSQFQRLESLGQLTGGIAHDFNNLITVILGNAELLEEALTGAKDLFELAQLIRVAGERGAQLTSRLLAFARRQTLEPDVLDPMEVIGGVRALIQKAVGKNVQLRIESCPEVWTIIADRTQLEAALLNLCINARDAMPGGGCLTIQVSNGLLDPPDASTSPHIRRGHYVHISVTDSGEGMRPEVAARAFEPFFTTKQPGKGNGLGLSMVYGFVTQSRGHVSIETSLGNGCTVNLYLPRAEMSAGMTSQATEDSSRDTGWGEDGGGKHILLVEDDELVRIYGKNVLQQLNYVVTEARNGDEALALLKLGIRADLLFTDVVMPGRLNGPQLAMEAERLRPGLPVLFTSGYVADAVLPAGTTDPARHLLQKPYDKETLARRIHKLLHAKSPPV